MDDRAPNYGDTWATPPAFFRPLHQEFGFTVDAAALPTNTKLPRFWSPEDDGLAQDWKGERVWCNPPYSDIKPWVAKASYRDAEISVLLLPARVGSDWFHEYVAEPDRQAPWGLRFHPWIKEVRPVRGRVKFLGAKKTPPWDTLVVVFRG